ncbi:MAG: hypothetical protein AB1486_28725, partial [Planctomycetota bacterium]
PPARGAWIETMETPTLQRPWRIPASTVAHDGPSKTIDFHAPIKARMGGYDTVVEVEGQASLRFDACGRWGSLRLGDAFYRRTLDGGAVRVATRHGPPADLADPAPVHEQARALAASLHDTLAASRAPLQLAGPAKDARQLLERLRAVTPWTADRFVAERERFAATYPEPIRILPPDRYRDAVVLGTLGCPWGKCAFCESYQGQPFRVLDEDEFSRHLDAVLALFGSSAVLRGGVFLGAANALALPQKRLLHSLGQIATHFPLEPRGIAAFWDPDHAPPRTHADWEALHRSGLRRVYVGLETGEPRVRAALGKSPDIGRLVEAVRTLVGNPIGAGLIVLAGAGGEQAAEPHRTATADVLTAIGLRPADTVFVSPLERSRPPDRLRDETRRLGRLLAARLPCKIVPYRLDMFRYYA